MSKTDHIVIPTAPAGEAADRPSQATVLTSGSSPAAVNAVFDGLDELLAACRGASVEKRLTTFIPALIQRGINTFLFGRLSRMSANAHLRTFVCRTMLPT